MFTLGFCLCDRGFGGADCSLDLTQGPHVTALDNLGLCDVRTKPCRDVIVVAEQLATKAAEDELKCIIEIYKVSLWFLFEATPNYFRLISIILFFVQMGAKTFLFNSKQGIELIIQKMLRWYNYWGPFNL